MTIFVLGFIATGCVCGLAWALCAASARADEMAERAEEVARQQAWRADHGRAQIVLKSREGDEWRRR